MSDVLKAGRPLNVEEVGSGKAATSKPADLVIAADGSSSRMREIVQSGPQREYPGYVAWRGPVPTRDLSAELVNIIELRTAFLHA
jgi:2-polyprenyl-6-methoxyphenol hydroxylase-like FAD-dependent oxidoreductase